MEGGGYKYFRGYKYINISVPPGDRGGTKLGGYIYFKTPVPVSAPAIRIMVVGPAADKAKK